MACVPLLCYLLYKQDRGTSQISVNAAQQCEPMHHPVNLCPCMQFQLFVPLRVALLVAHVEDVLGVVAGDCGEGESGEDDCDDAGGDEARLEGVLGGRVVVLREVVETGEDDPGEGDVLRHVEVEAEDVAQGLQIGNQDPDYI